ncbi:hypothetical protein OSB04_026665 [Centaurea solstitialis]|uniref:Uncharacterized protein n=1 Tax=Centaurea solstitialis TaxID=347529 RepID=A0AA38SDN7_9ASTR|nr:hypothetical protein OSB04_026665 [Centaurea solstitialis]
MKPSLFYVSFILIVNTGGIAFAIEGAVIDSSGNKVLNNVPYHLGPLTAAKGGGFKLTNTMNNKKICPFDVVQEPSASSLGDKFTFTLINANRPRYLRTEHILAIGSGSLKGPCEKSTFWTIPDAEGKAPGNLITTGGGFEQRVTCFELVEYPKPKIGKVQSYMLQHCPGRCSGVSDNCFNVSMYVDKKGVRRLASTGTDPFEFVFHKVAKYPNPGSIHGVSMNVEIP